MKKRWTAEVWLNGFLVEAEFPLRKSKDEAVSDANRAYETFFDCEESYASVSLCEVDDNGDIARVMTTETVWEAE